ncbi:hypothetical protein ARMSODRAFT_959955 [Armillaria solidipes]|uniref:Uncharacterized protein n=1 Tax=Armillaria solidipes TaxID=1076256 RepID=A0A2H3BSF9_9AGAR|nr:hypothetical protein ARMSODRAFT_959955 [Armillaria solidipes]
MNMREPKPTFVHLVSQVKSQHPGFATSTSPSRAFVAISIARHDEENNSIWEIRAPNTLIAVGRYSRADCHGSQLDCIRKAL